MINMPLNDIIVKIKEQKSISDTEINDRIKQKMDQLSGLISKEGAAYIVANELGVKLMQSSGLVKIKDIMPGQRNVDTAGKVMRKFDLIEFERNGRKGKVQSLILADDSGQLRITTWHDQTAMFSKVNTGDVIKIENGFVKENQGNVEIHLNDRSKIELNPDNVNIGNVQGQIFEKRVESVRKKINQLVENDNNVEVLATIVQVYDPRFFEQCPECRKRPVLQNEKFVCNQHGTITPKYGYVTNVMLDDGTDSIRTTMFTEQMQRLFKKSDAELVAIKDSPEKFEELKTELLGEQVLIRGKITMNAMFDRLEMRAFNVQHDVDPEKEIEVLKTEQKNQDVNQSSNETSNESSNEEKEIPSIDDL